MVVSRDLYHNIITLAEDEAWARCLCVGVKVGTYGGRAYSAFMWALVVRVLGGLGKLPVLQCGCQHNEGGEGILEANNIVHLLVPGGYPLVFPTYT